MGTQRWDLLSHPEVFGKEGTQGEKRIAFGQVSSKMTELSKEWWVEGGKAAHGRQMGTLWPRCMAGLCFTHHQTLFFCS